MSTNYNHHIYNWLGKIQTNIENFKEKEAVTNEERVEFISHQYHLVMIIHRALNGNVIFVGANPIDAVPMEEEPPIKKTRERKKKVVDDNIEPPIKKTRERKKKQ